MSAVTLLVVTCLSLTLAVIMSVVAWRITRREQRRAAARIAALAAEIHDQSSVAIAASGRGRAEIGVRTEPPRRYPSPASAGPRSFSHDLPLRDVTSSNSRSSSTGLFNAVQPEPTGTRVVAVVAFGVFILAAIAAVAIVFSGSRQAIPARATAVGAALGATQNALSPAAPPLELLALGHDRDGDRLTVRGVVRNPASGAAIDRLDVSVVGYGGDGRDATAVTSALTRVTAAPLAAGTETPFVVTLPNAADVGRYHVSFRIGDRVIDHVDRRTRATAGQEQ
jgi:hypothetical protein